MTKTDAFPFRITLSTLVLSFIELKTIANMRAPRMWFNRLIITSAFSSTVFKIKRKYVISKEEMMKKKKIKRQNEAIWRRNLLK